MSEVFVTKSTEKAACVAMVVQAYGTGHADTIRIACDFEVIDDSLVLITNRARDWGHLHHQVKGVTKVNDNLWDIKLDRPLGCNLVNGDQILVGPTPGFLADKMAQNMI